MARDSLSESERHCLENSAKNTDLNSEKYDTVKHELKSPRVRFDDEETITERFISTDEVDAAPRVKKVHILKNRSSSETSILLRTPSLTKHNERPISLDGTLMKTRENLNNNTSKENLNGRIGGILKQATCEPERIQLLTNDNDKTEAHTKENDLNNFKRNCNVYSVNQAKTILSERKKSLPLSNIPKLIGHRVSENGLKSPASDAIGLDDDIGSNKDFTTRTIGKISRGIGRLLRRSNSVRISEPDPVYKVAYLGNVLTGWARGENCIEKPLATLWRNYNQSTKPDVVMKLSITNSGLKGATKEHGLTEYWSHRITYCASPPHFPKIFCWVYRHEGRKLKHELRCHAVLCSKEPASKKITEELQVKLKQALAEFKKDKISKQNARLSLANSVYENPTMPRRKILLSIGANNYRPPLERSKSAPKLGAIEEICSEEEEEVEVDVKAATKEQLNGNRMHSGSLGRSAEKIKSPRKHSLPDHSEIYRRIDESRNEQNSFSDEVFDLLGERLQLSENKSLTANLVESSRDKNLTNPKKSDTSRCKLGSINELNEIEETKSPFLARDSKMLEMLGHGNFITDSDDGSVTSGCETASTTTSSDAEPTSLPPNPHEECYHTKLNQKENEKTSSVLNRVQDYSLDCERRLVSLVSDFRTDSGVHDEKNFDFNVSLESAHDLKTDDSPLYEEHRISEEVNCVPIGEKKSFIRRSTYPPLNNVHEILSDFNNQFDTLINNMTEYELLASSGENEVFKNSGDNLSACSDESGYSELLENGKDSTVANTIMV